MTPEELNTASYHKMEAEQDSYRDWLLTLPPDEILQHAYEYAVRQDILFAMEDLELQPEQCQALMKSPCPVADVLRDFEKLELGYMETLRDCIEGRADKLKYGALFEQNNDFVGWISIDETSIHYPVMQTPDNPDYYLKHGFDKLLAQTKKVISGNKEGYDAELAQLREKHAETEERIKRLVDSLSVATDTSAKYVMEQIDELHQQSEQEQSRLSKLEALTEQSRMLHQEFAFHQEMIESFAHAVDTATLEEKRRLLRTIVKKVVWDGKNAYVYLFAEDGEADLPPVDQLMCLSGEYSE